MLVISLLKAKDYGKLVAVKKRDKSGKVVTRWLSPGEKGQGELFDKKDQGKEGTGGYRAKLKQGRQTHQIKPLIEIVSKLDAGLAKKLATKYRNYRFDQDTQELDLKMDFETAKYMRKLKAEPKHADDYQAEYNQKTDKLAKQINNRKLKMLKVKLGNKVKVNGKEATIVGFSKRGYPKVRIGKAEQYVFFEELAA